MPAFDALAPDQKAVLQLLLAKGKSYGDIASLLQLDASSVRERALDALDVLGADVPEVNEITPERQDELSDHLLLQQTASERAQTRRFLEGSAPGRAWARGVSTQLRPIAGDALPDVPAEAAETEEAFGALEERTAAREQQQRSSRLGGVLVLGALAALAVIGLFVLFGRGGSDEATPVGSSDGATRSAATTGASGTSGAAGTKLPQQQINLAPSDNGSKALGYALLAEAGFSFLAEGLPASNKYFVWLYNSKSDALPVGFATYDTKTKRLAGAAPTLPQGAEKYSSIVITRETSRSPTAPGSVVLRGELKRS